MESKLPPSPATMQPFPSQVGGGTGWSSSHSTREASLFSLVPAVHYWNSLMVKSREGEEWFLLTIHRVCFCGYFPWLQACEFASHICFLGMSSHLCKLPSHAATNPRTSTVQHIPTCTFERCPWITFFVLILHWLIPMHLPSLLLQLDPRCNVNLVIYIYVLLSSG